MARRPPLQHRVAAEEGQGLHRGLVGKPQSSQNRAKEGLVRMGGE